MLSATALVTLLATCPFSFATALVNWETLDYERYVTEPHIRQFKLNTIERTIDQSKLSPSYIFYAPFPPSKGQDRHWIGPHILDSNGDLLWWGNASTGARTQNLRPCSYLSDTEDHLCFSEATFTDLGRVNGTNHILDNTYTPVTPPFGKTGTLNYPNPHEFMTTPGGKTMLNVVYEVKQVDLTPYNGPAEGYVEEACFQEIDVQTNTAIFEWCGLDVLELWHSYIFLDIPENVVNHTGEAYGKGTLQKPWDYFHINSVDKTPSNDYIVSARHLNTILKIAGPNSTSRNSPPPGSIVWRLGGKFSSFTNSSLLDLSRQHHATYLGTTASGLERYSIFNNHWQAGPSDRRISNAQIFTIDPVSMTVVSTHKYHNPEGHLSLAQGSAQVLPNGNMFIGWGTVPQFTEFSTEGDVLWHVHLEKYRESEGLANMQNYRVYKAPWVGKPRTEPKLVAYRRGCEGGPLVGHVSWNGATEVKWWRFSVSDGSGEGAWRKEVVIERDGFETVAVLKQGGSGKTSFERWVKVEALDAKSNVLGSTVVETFVPNPQVMEGCDELSCAAGHEWFEYAEELSVAALCPVVAQSMTGSWMMIASALVALLFAMRYVTKKRGQRARNTSGKETEMFMKRGREREHV